MMKCARCDAPIRSGWANFKRHSMFCRRLSTALPSMFWPSQCAGSKFPGWASTVLPIYC